MTEAEWLANADPGALLNHLVKPSKRKLRLYAVACCRRVWAKLKDKWSRNAVEVAERHADGLCTEDEALLAGAKASNAQFDVKRGKSRVAAACGAFVLNKAELAATYCGLHAAQVVSRRGDREDPEERAAQAVLIRDIFGNPFQPITFLPEWRTPTVLALAQQMYDSGDFSAMPILADSVQDAGCEDESLLGHCRVDGCHVRGCAVIDAILGKS